MWFRHVIFPLAVSTSTGIHTVLSHATNMTVPNNVEFTPAASQMDRERGNHKKIKKNKEVGLLLKTFTVIWLGGYYRPGVIFFSLVHGIPDYMRGL